MARGNLGFSDVSRPSRKNRDLYGVAFRSALEKGAKKRKHRQPRRFRIFCCRCGGYRLSDTREKICPKCG